jgi:hypothetical protein
MGVPVLYRSKLRAEKPVKPMPAAQIAKVEIKHVEVSIAPIQEQSRPSLHFLEPQAKPKGTLASRRIGKDRKDHILDLFPA